VSAVLPASLSLRAVLALHCLELIASPQPSSCFSFSSVLLSPLVRAVQPELASSMPPLPASGGRLWAGFSLARILLAAGSLIFLFIGFAALQDPGPWGSSRVADPWPSGSYSNYTVWSSGQEGLPLHPVASPLLHPAAVRTRRHPGSRSIGTSHSSASVDVSSLDPDDASRTYRPLTPSAADRICIASASACRIRHCVPYYTHATFPDSREQYYTLAPVHYSRPSSFTEAELTVDSQDVVPRSGSMAVPLGPMRSQQESIPVRISTPGYAWPRDDPESWNNNTYIFTAFAHDVTPWAAKRVMHLESVTSPFTAPALHVSESEQGERVDSANGSLSGPGAFSSGGRKGLEDSLVGMSEQPGALSGMVSFISRMFRRRSEQPGALSAAASVTYGLSMSPGSEPEQPGAVLVGSWFDEFVSGSVVSSGEQPGALSPTALMFVFPRIHQLAFHLVSSPISDTARIRACLVAFRLHGSHHFRQFTSTRIVPHTCFDCAMTALLTLLMGLAGYLWQGLSTPPPTDGPCPEDETEEDGVDSLRPFLSMLTRCQMVRYRVGRWTRGTKLVASIQPDPDHARFVRQARAYRRRGRAARIPAVTCKPIVFRILSWCVTGACLGVAITVWNLDRTSPARTPGCPILAYTQILGAALSYLLRAVAVAGWIGGHQSCITLTKAWQVAPQVVTGVTRMVAATVAALWPALRPAFNVCHPEGVLSKAPGWYASACSTAQPVLWAAVSAHAALVAGILGPIFRLMGTNVLACVLAFSSAPAHVIFNAAPSSFGALAWSLVLLRALLFCIAGAARGVASIRRARWMSAPGMSGIFTPCIWVGYMSCMCIASYVARPGFPTVGTSPVLYFLKLVLWASSLVSVTSLYTVTGCPTTWRALRVTLLSSASSLRTQVQVASLLSVAVTAELAVRPDVAQQVLKPLIHRLDVQVSVVILTFTIIASGLFPYAWEWVVSRTKCLPAQPTNRRWRPDLSSGRPGRVVVDTTTPADVQGTDGGANLPPACAGCIPQPAGHCSQESSDQAPILSGETTPEGVEGANPTPGASPAHAQAHATPGPVARVQGIAVLGPTASASPEGDSGDLASTRIPRVCPTATCTDPGTQPSVALPGTPGQADCPCCSETELGDTAVSCHLARSGEVPACNQDGDQPPTSDGDKPTGADGEYRLAIYGYRAVSFAVIAGGAYLLLTLIGRVVSISVALSGPSAARDITTLMTGVGTALLGRPLRSAGKHSVLGFLQYWPRMLALSVLLLLAVSSWALTHAERVTRNLLRLPRAGAGKRRTQVCVLWDEDPSSREVVRIWSLWLALTSCCYFPVPADIGHAQSALESDTPVFAGNALFSKSGLPDITATSGIALMEQIDAWLDALLVLHFRIKQTERKYVSAFKATVGRSSPIYTMLESPDPDGEYVGTFMEEIIRRADAATAQFRLHSSLDIANAHLAKACKNYYPAFSPPVKLVQAIATAELEATRPHNRVERAREAEQELKLLERQFQEARSLHDSRDGMEQFEFISEHPTLCKHVPTINSKVAHYRDAERERRQRFGEDHDTDAHAEQYNNVEDFVALHWARDVIMLRLGAINHLTVKLFEQLRMLPGEHPMQAYTRAKREAEVIANAKVGSFSLEHALYDLVTVAERPDGSTFFTKTLYDLIYPTVQTQLMIQKIPPNAHAEITMLWVQTADRVFFQISGRNHTSDKAMAADLEKHGRWNQEFKKLRYKSLPGQTPSSSGKGDGKKAGDKFCIIHQQCGHTTDECNEVAKRLQIDPKGGKGKAQKSPKGDTVAVTTPAAGADQAAIGSNPNSLFVKAQAKTDHPGKEGGKSRDAPAKRYEKCPICSAIAGSEQKHGAGSCYLDGTTPIPDFWRPRNQKILNHANKLRKERGQKPLQLWTPPAPAAVVEPEAPVVVVKPVRQTKGRTAKVVAWDDSLVATGEEGNVLPLVAAIDGDTEPTLAGYVTSDPTADIRQHVSFDQKARKFTCLSTSQTCQVQRDPIFGMLMGVNCTLCRKTFDYVQVPREWRTVALWTITPHVLPAEAQAGYTPPPTTFDSAAQGAASAAAVASATRDFHNVEETPTMEEVQLHLMGNGVLPNLPHTSLPINRLAWSLIIDEVRRTGASQWEGRAHDLLFGRDPEYISDQMLRLSELKEEFQSHTVRLSSPWSSPTRAAAAATPFAPADGAAQDSPAAQPAEDVEMRPADVVNVPPIRLDRGKAPAFAVPSSTAADPTGLADDLASLRMGAGPSQPGPSNAAGPDPAVAALQTAVEALQDAISRQDSELRALREQNAQSLAAAQAAERLATTATTLLKQCVSVQVADSFQQQINALVEVMNALPDQLEQLEGSLSQRLKQAAALAGPPATPTMPEGVATLEDLQGLERRMADTKRDADLRFGEVDDHVAKFLHFMRDTPFMTYVNTSIAAAQQKANEAWIHSNAVDERVRQLPIQRIRDDIADQLEAHNNLMVRASALEQQTATFKVLKDRVDALSRAETRFIHDFNFTWEYLKPCLKALFPAAPRVSPMFNTASSPLSLHSTLFSLRKLADNSRHTPPQHDTSILRRLLRPATATDWGRAQAAMAVPTMAVPPSETDTSRWETDTASEMNTTISEADSVPAHRPAAPTPLPATPVPTAAQQMGPRSFAEAVRRPERAAAAPEPAPAQARPASQVRPSPPLSPADVMLAAATALPDSPDSDAPAPPGLHTAPPSSPARAATSAVPAGTPASPGTGLGPQLVHRTTVPVVQLKATSSMQRSGTAPLAGTPPPEPLMPTLEVQSRLKAEAPAPTAPPTGAVGTPPPPKMEEGEGSGSQTTVEDGLRELPPFKLSGLQNLPRIQVTAPASPEASTPATPETPASRKQKRELAKLQSDWPSFQADTSLERKARRRTPTSVSPQREMREDAAPVHTMSVYEYDSDFDEVAELAALDALIAAPPSGAAPASTLGLSSTAQPGVDLDFDIFEDTLTEDMSFADGEPVEEPLAAAAPADQPSPSGSAAAVTSASRGTTSWPTVEPKLFPTNGKTTIGQHRGGEYSPSTTDVALHKQFFSRRPLLVDLKQDDPETSLQLFDQENARSLLPKRVMIDSGARVFILISPSIAKALDLTIDPGTAPIKGIGGAGGSLGATKDYINVRLGACALGEVNDDPCTGCFTLKVKAIVMTEEAVKNIGHHVLLGQNFLRYCIGMTDPLTERFYYSPAWWTQACRDFRVSVPCTMSTPDNAAAVRNFLGVLDMGDDDVAFVDQTIWSNTLKQPQGSALASAVAAPLAPGFPQTENVTPEQYATFRQEQKERNEETRRVARDTLAAAQAQAANELANIVEATGLVFPMSKLRHSGRLLEGMRLDLSGASQTVMAQLSKLKETIITDVMKALSGKGAAAPAPPAAEAPTIRRVASVQVDPRDDLPYAVPVHWAAHGGGETAPHNELLMAQPKSCLRAAAEPFNGKAKRQVHFAPVAATAATALATVALPHIISVSSKGHAF
jgi:hypothetical protein